MTNEEFALLWNSSVSANAVAAAAGQTSQGAKVKACKLRKMGFVLKFMPLHVPKSLSERLLEKVNITDGCWEWTGSVNEKGYGQISTTRKDGPILTHRASYLIFCGPIADGLLVLHRCDNPRCVRPEHLFLGTACDNSRDMSEKERARGQRNAPRHEWYKRKSLLAKAKRELADL